MSEPKVETKPEGKASKQVKIKLLRDCVIGKDVKKAGSFCEVDEEIAKEYCDKSFDGYMPIYGYAPQAVETETENAMARRKIFRAERVG